MAAGGHFGSPIWAILDDLKSLSIAFLAISDQYTIFFFFFYKMAASGHFGSPITPKNNRVLPLCVINGYAKYEVDRWIYDRVREPTWAFLYKMTSRGHFVFPIDAKNHRILVIWDLNGNGEYEFEWCIGDKVMACTSVGVRRRRRNQKHNITEIFKFRGYNNICA